MFTTQTTSIMTIMCIHLVTLPGTIRQITPRVILQKTLPITFKVALLGWRVAAPSGIVVTMARTTEQQG